MQWHARKGTNARTERRIAREETVERQARKIAKAGKKSFKSSQAVILVVAMASRNIRKDRQE